MKNAGGLNKEFLRSSLTLFFPAYNDASTIGDLVAAAHQVAGELTEDFEVLVINDGSSDETGSLLETLASKYPKLRPIHHPQNLGYGGALISGFANASKDWVFYTDGDGQYDVRQLKDLVREIKPGIGLVNGFKVRRSDSWYRKILGRCYHMLIKTALGLKIRDTDCDFRLIRREVLDSFRLSSRSGAICAELVWRIQRTGCGIVEVPVNHYARKSGQSQFFSFKHLWRLLIEMPKLIFTLTRESVQLRVSSLDRAKDPAIFQA